MLGTYYYHEIIRRTIIAFGTLFNEIDIHHKKPDGSDFSIIRVPIAYGPTEKFLARLEQKPDLRKRVAITLPRLAFEMVSIKYDNSRKVSTMQTFKALSTSDNKIVKKVYMPVPYNLGIKLSIMAQYNDDALQIVEQILPYFQPSYNLTLELLPSIGETKDVVVNLESVNYQDDYEGDMDQRRALIYTFRFTAKTYVYGPVREPSVIRKAITDTYASLDTVNAPRIQRYTVQPDPIDADADDNFGFNETFSEFTDIQKWNPETGEDEPI